MARDDCPGLTPSWPSSVPFGIDASGNNVLMRRRNPDLTPIRTVGTRAHRPDSNALENGMTESLYDRVVAAIGQAYELEDEIGRGGMSVVFRARDLRLNRPVA